MVSDQRPHRLSSSLALRVIAGYLEGLITGNLRNMRHITIMTIALCTFPAWVLAAAPDETAFMGVFTTNSHPVSSCSVIRADSAMVFAQFAQGLYGSEAGYGVLQQTGNEAVNIFSLLADNAMQKGYNGVVGARIEVSHSTDAVYETGQNWRNNDMRYEGDGTFVVTAYGTPVEFQCDR